METTDCVSLMIMYEDESVEVRYKNGTQLQLSPCGSEFMLLKPADPHGHPLQPAERVRQRTRFSTSKYKELIVAVLTFRNKYASRPYLPEALIPIDHKKPFLSIESDVMWPEWSSEVEVGPGGNAIVRSEDQRASLMLSPSGEEFFVEFTCNISRPQNQHQSMKSLSRNPDNRPGCMQQVICDSTGNQSKRTRQPNQERSCSREGDCAAQQKPEQMYQSTTVVQHHSCCAVSPIWSYPLSLAQHRSKSKDADAEETSNSKQTDTGMNMSNKSLEERRSQLPQALPLACSSPHWHRWKFKDPLSKEEDTDLPSELVKLIWRQGVTYRILSGVVPVVEISPGDGSVIRSNGVLNSYFNHHKVKLQEEELKELTYHVNSLPPDVPGQKYSVYAIVSRASRILSSYNQAKLSLKLPATPSCIQEDLLISRSKSSEQYPSTAVPKEHRMIMSQAADSISDLVAAELEKIKRFNFLLENSSLLKSESKCRNLKENFSETIHKPLSEDCIAEALLRTSKAIQDIDALIAGETLT
uniref:Chromosome 5 open reading frame 34 n=1 Tax=Nothobranchius kuhntae TaxID=321403 RepID=A0A1A8HXW6_NOTKU